jgi:hypothetical protein
MGGGDDKDPHTSNVSAGRDVTIMGERRNAHKSFAVKTWDEITWKT